MKALFELTGVINFKGNWNASTNSPALASGVGTTGDTYICNVAGSTLLDGNSEWFKNDVLVYNGTAWEQQAYSNGAADFRAYLSGNWYGSTYNGISTGQVIVNSGRMYAHPFIVSSPSGSATFRSLGIRVVTAGTASAFKAAIYDATGVGNRPGNRVAQATTAVATTSSGTDVPISLNAVVTLQNGLYWLVSIHTGTILPIVQSFNTISDLNTIAGSATISGAVGQAANYGGMVYADTTYASAFPSTFGAATELVATTGRPPLIAIQAN